MAASNINRVVLTGNLTSDPDLRSTQGGMSVCKLRIAVNTRRKDASGQWADKPNYFDVTVWGAQGENCARYLAKGRPVAIDGRLEWREWQTNDNPPQKRQAIDIIADTVQFLSSPRDDMGGGNGQGFQGGQSFQSRPDLPPADTSDFGPGPSSDPFSQPVPATGGGSPMPTGEDDIPF